MKKIGVTINVLFFLIVGCKKGDVSKVKIDYGTSSIYTKEEMDFKK